MKKYFDNIYKDSYNDFYKIVEKKIKDGKRMFIVTANPSTLMNALTDDTLNEILLDKNNYIVSDGIGLIKVLRKFNYDIKERITGVDLVADLLQTANKNKLKVYFFGATEEVRLKLIDKVSKEYPDLIIVGSCNGYVSNKDKVFTSISELKPDIILVAMGIPMQEKLIHDNIDKFDKGIFMGIGGALDVISGTKKRAPKIFIKLNLEWFYRIMSEPKRIKKFYNENIKFLFKAMKMK